MSITLTLKKRTCIALLTFLNWFIHSCPVAIWSQACFCLAWHHTLCCTSAAIMSKRLSKCIGNGEATPMPAAPTDWIPKLAKHYDFEWSSQGPIRLKDEFLARSPLASPQSSSPNSSSTSSPATSSPSYVVSPGWVDLDTFRKIKRQTRELEKYEKTLDAKPSNLKLECEEFAGWGTFRTQKQNAPRRELISSPASFFFNMHV